MPANRVMLITPESRGVARIVSTEARILEARVALPAYVTPRTVKVQALSYLRNPDTLATV